MPWLCLTVQVYVKRHLQSGLPASSFASMLLTFSAQTSANMTRDIIDGRMEKRRRGVYGPPTGKNMVIFVDDLNMPQVGEPALCRHLWHTFCSLLTCASCYCCSDQSGPATSVTANGMVCCMISSNAVLCRCLHSSHQRF